MMAEPQQALQDIEFIKQLIAKNRRKAKEASPFLIIWGLYIMIGFIGMQFDSTIWPQWYWAIGAVVGGILSAVIGVRLPRGSTGRLRGSYGWLFWLPFLVTMLSGCFMMVADIVKLEYLSFFWLTLLGMAYVSLGAMLGKGPVYMGIWFILLAVITRLFLLEYHYLILGLLGGGSNIIVGIILLRWKRHD